MKSLATARELAMNTARRRNLPQRWQQPLRGAPRADEIVQVNHEARARGSEHPGQQVSLHPVAVNDVRLRAKYRVPQACHEPYDLGRRREDAEQRTAGLRS